MNDTADKDLHPGRQGIVLRIGEGMFIFNERSVFIFIF
jgi:hypothetical protein